MGSQSLDYAAIISDLEAKKAAIEATIASLRSAMALGTLGTGQGGGDLPVSSNLGMLNTYGGDVPAGAFLGKSIPEAARFYLEIVKKKQTSREIAEALQKGGMESTSGNFVGIVHAVLDRSRKSANAAIVKLGTQWGLAGWYPKGILNNAAAAPRKKPKKGKVTKKVAPKKAKSDALLVPQSPSTSSDTEEPKGRAIDRAVEYLKSEPHGEHSLTEIADHLGMGEKGARLTLGQIVKAGRARMSAPGMYTVASFA